MGCITSRGYPWPPAPYKRHIVVNRAVKTGRALFDNANVACASFSTESYVWEYPGVRHGGPGGTRFRFDEEASPGQEVVIRHLEGD